MKTILSCCFALCLLMPAAARAQSGVAVTFDEAGEGLIVRAAGQDAINLLYGVTSEEAAQLRACNRLTEVLFNELAEAGAAVAPINTIFGVADRAEAAADVTRMLALFEEAYGTLQDFEVLGSTPRMRRGTYTYVQAVFGPETVTFRLTWKDQKLYGFAPGRPEEMMTRIEFIHAEPMAAEVTAR